MTLTITRHLESLLFLLRIHHGHVRVLLPKALAGGAVSAERVVGCGLLGDVLIEGLLHVLVVHLFVSWTQARERVGAWVHLVHVSLDTQRVARPELVCAEVSVLVFRLPEETLGALDTLVLEAPVVCILVARVLTLGAIEVAVKIARRWLLLLLVAEHLCDCLLKCRLSALVELDSLLPLHLLDDRLSLQELNRIEPTLSTFSWLLGFLSISAKLLS